MTRNYDRDKQAIQLTITSDVNRTLAAESKRIDQNIEKLAQAVRSDIDSRLQSTITPLMQNIGQLQEHSLKNVQSIIDLNQGTVASGASLAGLAQLHGARIDQLQIEIWRLTAEEEIAKGTPINALIYFVWMASKYIDLGEIYNVGPQLDRIAELIAAPDVKVWSRRYTVEQILNLLQRIPPDNEHLLILAQRIRGLIEQSEGESREQM